MLDYHMRYHVTLEQYPCEICGKSFYQTSFLRQHQRTKHEIGMYCEICKDPIENKEALKVHMKTHGEFKCEICNKTFITPFKLKVHQSRHKTIDTESRAPCDFCTKTFDPKRLRPHVFKYHPEKYSEWSEGI